MTPLLDHLLALLGYDAPLQTATHGQRLWVDQIPVDVAEDQNGLMLWSALGNAPDDPAKRLAALQQLAWIATARSAEEDWVLSYDAEAQNLFLWGKLDRNASDEELQNALESFVATVEWWLHRLQNDPEAEASDRHTASANPWDDAGLMMFRP